MRRRGLAARLLAAGLTFGSASAAEPILPPAVLPPSVLPGLGKADPRRPVTLSEPPWRGIGRVQTELGGRCTGALIGPRQVLTAAHCLVAQRTGGLVRPGSVHFLLGYDKGVMVAHAGVTNFRIGPGFDPARLGPPAADWAVLTLDAALGTPDRVLPLLAAPPPLRTSLTLGGYQQDRPEVVLADSGCRMLGVTQGLVIHDCAGTRGASGAPLLARGPDGGWAIAGVAARAARDVAMGVAAIVPPLR